MELELTPQERDTLAVIGERAKPRYVRRARVILGQAAALPIHLIAESADLSPRRVRYWLRQFQARRMDVFPPNLMRDLNLDALEPAEPDLGPPLPPSADSAQGVTIRALAEEHDVDLAHARHVADLALQLYDLTQEVHFLGSSFRIVLEWAALLHKVGLARDPERPHRAGRAIILERELECTSDERDLLALIVGAQRGRIRAGKAKSERMESPRWGGLVLSALLRMAIALDCSRTGTVRIESVQRSAEGLHLVISGRASMRDATCATKEASVWRRVTGLSITYDHQEPLALALLAMLDDGSAPSGKGVGLSPDEPMGEAGRKVIGFHLRRFLAHESGTRDGADIEDLHDMRVATRRMRAAFRVFGSFFEPKATKPLLKGLREAAGILGRVRDLDVFIEKAGHYLEGLPDSERDCLDPLLEVWQEERRARRKELVGYLDGSDYAAFCRQLAHFVSTPGVAKSLGSIAEPTPMLIAHVAPAAVYTRWAEVLAYSPYLKTATLDLLHNLRIHCKRLRYTLEFFQEVLGPEARDAIKQVTAVQDHLGDLQDAVVATEMLRGFLNDWAEWQRERRLLQRVDIHGVSQYLAACQACQFELLESFPQFWAETDSATMRRWLSSAISVL